MKKLSLFSVTLLFIFTACSSILYNTPNPNLRYTLVRVTGDYLNNVALADEKKATAMIFWSGYKQANQTDREQFRKQLSTIGAHWPVNPQHPLMLLNVLDVEVKEDSARVTLNKPNSKIMTEEIWVDLIWNGSGWLVESDSLFGPDGSFARLIPPSDLPIAAN